MGNFNLTLAEEFAPADIFAGMPPAFRAFLNRGFEQIAQIDRSKIGPIASRIADGLNVTDDVGVSEIVKLLGHPLRDKSSFSAAINLLVVLVTSRDDIEKIVSAGEEAGAIPKDKGDGILAFAKGLVIKKATLTEVVESTSLANEVAPSFERLSIAIELRFGFDESKISKTVPVAVCSLDTDSRNSQCFFQMKKSDIVQMISQLQKAESQLNAVEAWVKERR